MVKALVLLLGDTCKTATARTAEEALDLLDPFEPYLVLLDITLPGMQGEPLNYAIYPYAEVDGKVHTAMETEYLYANVDSPVDSPLGEVQTTGF